jgi:hypothetical protein
VYNCKYAPTTLEVKVEEKLHQGVRELRRSNTTLLDYAGHVQEDSNPF